ncbi:hypothetical protein [Lactococcus petauri]|uniref:hypothetical protein n=1 Tax=Lactococcus petauri TaxID=1940789 RepID=UPI003851D900
MTKTKLQVMREKKSEGKMIKFEVVEADVIENTITLDAGDYFKNGQIITLNEKMILLESKPDIPINKYEEDLAKASEILNKAHLPKIIDIAVNAIDDAIVDIDMEAEQEWHAKITLESSLIEIAEQIENQPKLSIPKKVAEELEKLTGKTNWESTPYSVIEEKGKINTWAYLGHGKCSEQLYKFCRDNTRLMHAYLNPLTRPFVEVEG